MVLATIIRLEMAYPGVGILAGDSLQYLSVVTAHAVIMVFFMIMPLLFGAFGNFLLPTQLGVHDVAFPRLNSAAFWFLPAGLLMLVQLVCLDRRYQRMNCYNIREIQTVLKSKYTPNVANSTNVRFSLNDTTIGLRYQLGGLDFINSSVLTYYQNSFAVNSPYATLHTFLHKPLVEFETINLFLSKASLLCRALLMSQSFENASPVFTSTSSGSFVAKLLPGSFTSGHFSLLQLATFHPSNAYANPLLVGAFLIQPFTQTGLLAPLLSFPSLTAFPDSLSKVVAAFNPTCVTSVFSGPTLLSSRSPLKLEFNALFTNSLSLLATGPSLKPQMFASNYDLEQSYTATSNNMDGALLNSPNVFQEKSSDQRFLRSVNPVFKYDFKVGNYMPDEAKKMNPHLFMSIKDVTTGVRKSS